MTTRPDEPALDAVATHHRDGFRSGVARFNEVLAEQLGVPLLSIFDAGLDSCACPLLSFKVSEMDEDERGLVERGLERWPWRGEIFLHDYQSLPLEQRLVQHARRVHCGNEAIHEEVRSLNPHAHVLWSPGLLLDDRPFATGGLSVFSFGMAHKIRTDLFRRLRSLLDATELPYALYVSAANHETTRMQDAQLIFAEMHEIFPSLFFLGNLSDVAVVNYLRSTTYFASFFPGGVRANNGSVAAAMEKGAVVITNLDEYSPPDLRHMVNVIDVNRVDRLPSDPEVLDGIGRAAQATARTRSWSRLLERLTEPVSEGVA